MTCRIAAFWSQPPTSQSAASAAGCEPPTTKPKNRPDGIAVSPGSQAPASRSTTWSAGDGPSGRSRPSASATSSTRRPRRHRPVVEAVQPAGRVLVGPGEGGVRRGLCRAWRRAVVVPVLVSVTGPVFGRTDPLGQPRTRFAQVSTVHESIDARLRAFIEAQPVFFVGTAPLAGGHVNVSPKGLSDTFAVVDEHTVAYLDITASGAETIAHLRENGRITLMFCSFERHAEHRTPARDRPRGEPSTTTSSPTWAARFRRTRRPLGDRRRRRPGLGLVRLLACR